MSCLNSCSLFQLSTFLDRMLTSSFVWCASFSFVLVLWLKNQGKLSHICVSRVYKPSSLCLWAVQDLYLRFCSLNVFFSWDYEKSLHIWSSYKKSISWDTYFDPSIKRVHSSLGAKLVVQGMHHTTLLKTWHMNQGKRLMCSAVAGHVRYKIRL